MDKVKFKVTYDFINRYYEGNVININGKKFIDCDIFESPIEIDSKYIKLI